MARDIARAAELRGVLNAPGWRTFRALAAELLKENTDAVMQCDDDAQALRLQRGGRGAEKFWNDLLRRVESAASIEASDVQGVTL